MKAFQTEFPGTYYDGKSANTYPVKLRLTRAQLELVFPQGRQVLWSYSTLSVSQTGSTGPVRLDRSSSEKDVLPESVVIEDPEFLKAAHRVAPDALGTIWNQPHKRSLRYFLMILTCVILPPFIFAVWVYGIPAMTDAVADRVPTEWEEKLGQNYYQTLFKDSIKEPDPQVRKALDEISRRLLASVPDQPYHFRVYVHPSKMVNAMALPGGTIILFQGLINKTETPEELAGVMAHEFQHVLKRHSTRGIIRSEAINILATVVSGDSMMNVLIQAGGVLEFLRYSRELESQADAEGMKMILASQVDPQGMVRVFKMLEEQQHLQLEALEKDMDEIDPKEKDLEEKESNDPESDKEVSELNEWMKYFSTHPAGEDRVETLKKMAEQTIQKPKPLLPGFDWKSMHRETQDQDFIF